VFVRFIDLSVTETGQQFDLRTDFCDHLHTIENTLR